MQMRHTNPIRCGERERGLSAAGGRARTVVEDAEDVGERLVRHGLAVRDRVPRPRDLVPPEAIGAVAGDAAVLEGAPVARKVRWPKRYKLAHALPWEYSYKGLRLAQLLGQLGVFLTRLLQVAHSCGHTAVVALALGVKVIPSPPCIFH